MLLKTKKGRTVQVQNGSKSFQDGIPKLQLGNERKKVSTLVPKNIESTGSII